MSNWQPKRVTKSKRFWVTTIITASMIPAVYYAIHLNMEGTAMTIGAGVFAAIGVYVRQETVQSSKKIEEDDVKELGQKK